MYVVHAPLQVPSPRRLAPTLLRRAATPGWKFLEICYIVNKRHPAFPFQNEFACNVWGGEVLLNRGQTKFVTSSLVPNQFNVNAFHALRSRARVRQLHHWRFHA